MLGGVAGVVVVLGVELLEWLRIDDPIGAVPVHGICGIWGTISLGLFACGKYGATGPAGRRQFGALKGLFMVVARRCWWHSSLAARPSRSRPSQSPWRSCCRERMGSLRVSRGRRTLRLRSSRARDFGLSGVCHLSLGCAERNGTASPFSALQTRTGDRKNVAFCQLTNGRRFDTRRQSNACLLPLNFYRDTRTR